MKRKKTIFITIILLALSQFLNAKKLHFTDPIYINDGYHPFMLADKQNNLHLVYGTIDKVLYQTGNMNGVFSEPEKIFEVDTTIYRSFQPIKFDAIEPARPIIIRQNMVWQPKFTFDKNENMHLALANSEGTNAFTWYTNNIGGVWKERSVVFNRFYDALNSATCPRIAVDDDLNAYVSVYTYGLTRSALAKLSLVDGKMKRVVAEPEPRLEGVEIFMHDNELWIAGHAGHKDDYLIIQQLDKNTLKGKGKEHKVRVGQWNELVSASIDKNGMIHMAGASMALQGRGGDKHGWYTNTKLASQGKVLSYHTEIRHHWGAALPIRDLVDTTLVYMIYPTSDITKKSDFDGGTYYFPCIPHLYYRIILIKNDKIIAENLKITPERMTLGNTFRYTPCMVAHPEGGMVVIFSECPDANSFMRRLYFTRIKWE